MPKITNEPQVLIRMTIQEARPDVSDYKSFASTYVPATPLIVEVPVPKSEVISQKEGETILTLAGWKAALREMARITDELRLERQQSIPRYQG